MPDKDRLEVVEGPHKGFSAISTSYLNSALFGSVFGLNTPLDKTASLRMTDKLDRLGLDMFTFGALLDFLITAREDGLIDPARFELPLNRDFESISLWADAIVSRKGSGELLAGGWRSLFDYLGREFDDLAPTIKDCDIIWDPRLVGLGTMEFEQIVSLKGPRSASGGSPTYVPGLTEESLPLFRRHLNRMGADDAAIDRIMDSPLGFNVGRMTRYAEDWYTILSSLGVCNRHFVNRFYSYDMCRKLFSAVTGFTVDEDHLRQSARKIWDLLRDLNQREGFGPDDDQPPEMWFKPMKGPNGEDLYLRDYFGKRRLSRMDITRLVEDYYDERGWK
jgi:aldehyde:ferredoxin oxidoreductase